MVSKVCRNSQNGNFIFMRLPFKTCQKFSNLTLFKTSKYFSERNEQEEKHHTSHIFLSIFDELCLFMMLAIKALYRLFCNSLNSFAIRFKQTR